MRKVSRTRAEAAFLAEELEILDSPPWPFARTVLWLIIALLMSAMAWSYFGQVDIVASACGSIIPDSRTKVVQAVAAGKVAALEVADGDRVRAGDVLVRMDAINAKSALAKAQEGLQAALLETEMARRLASVDFVSVEPAEVPLLADADAQSEIAIEQIAVQQEVLESLYWTQAAKAAQQRAELGTLEASLDRQLRQAEAVRKLAAQDDEVLVVQRAGAAAQLGKLDEEFPMAKQRLDSMRELRSRGVVSEGAIQGAHVKMLRLERERSELATRGRAIVAEGSRLKEQRSRDLGEHMSLAAETEARIGQLAAATAAAAAEFRSNMLELASVQSRKAQVLREDIVQLEQQLANHAVTAPVAGVVEQLAVHTIGAVLQPGQALLTIVPSDGDLVAEAEIPNKDVGFVEEGQVVRIKLDAYPYTNYGLIEGSVIDLADDAVEREGIGLVYRVRIRLLRDSLEVAGKQVRLRPGMSLTAEIRTGDRRVIEFFLDPLLRARDESLTVR